MCGVEFLAYSYIIKSIYKGGIVPQFSISIPGYWNQSMALPNNGCTESNLRLLDRLQSLFAVLFFNAKGILLILPRLWLRSFFNNPSYMRSLVQQREYVQCAPRL